MFCSNPLSPVTTDKTPLKLNITSLLNDGRLCPDKDLPPYTYVPNGPHPHPISDPKGHSYGHTWDVEALDEHLWRKNEAYLFGWDLFHNGFCWEAHEVWEALWIKAGRRGPTADFLKGLIKLAAAGVKIREGLPSGADNHSRRAKELFDSSAKEFGRALLFGIELQELLKIANQISELPPNSPSEKTATKRGPASRR